MEAKFVSSYYSHGFHTKECCLCEQLATWVSLKDWKNFGFLSLRQCLHYLSDSLTTLKISFQSHFILIC